MTELAPRSSDSDTGTVFTVPPRTSLPWWTASACAVLSVAAVVALAVTDGAATGLLILFAVLAGIAAGTAVVLAIAKEADRQRLEQLRAWVLAAPSPPEGDRDGVVMELWWTGRGAGLVWDGADVGHWRTDFHVDEAPARLTGRLAPKEPGDPVSIHRAGLSGDRWYLEVGPQRYLLVGTTLVDGAGRRWPLPHDVLGSAGDRRALVLPRDLGPRAGLVVVDRLARRAIAAASSGD